MVAFFIIASAKQAEAGPTLVVDAATGAVLSADRAGEAWYPASLTKVMTAYIIFEKLQKGHLKLDQKLLISPLAASQVPSKIGLRAGTTVTVDFALQSLLVYSANDMAYVLAEGASGTMHDFIGEMNGAAKKLGMNATHFVNPNGLFDPRHISSARDMALLASATLRQYPQYKHYFSQNAVSMGKRKLMNRNSLLRQMPEADGMKTGFVCNSGFNLIATASREGRQLIAVVMGAANGKARADQAQALLLENFSQTAPPPALQLEQLTNTPLGTEVPADLSVAVCKSKQPVTLTSAKDLGGWGISFGLYDSLDKADMALRGRLINPIGITAMGRAGVIQIPDSKTYAPMMWNQTQDESTALCTAYKTLNIPCEVMTPQIFTQLAVLAPDPVIAVKPAQAPGKKTKKPTRIKKRL